MGTRPHTRSSRRAPNVTLASLTIQRYNNGNGTQDAAIHIDDDDTAKAAASGWRLANLNVGFNSASGSGTGDNWTFLGGRFHDNRQEGIGGAVGNGVTVDGVEIDHNNFTDTTYTKRNWSCGDEAGGFKWVTNNVTVKNSRIHDNACKGLWADLNADNAVITNNLRLRQLGRGDLHRDLVRRDRHRQHRHRERLAQLQRRRQRLPVDVRRRHHARVERSRRRSRTTPSAGTATASPGTSRIVPTATPACWRYVSVTDNVISGAGVTGVAEDNGADLTQRTIVFSDNTFGGGIDFCNLSC